jgi:non-specific protein-tyrosine kinase
MNQFEQDEEAAITSLSVKEYFYLLWSWAWLIGLAGALAGAAALVVSLLSTPIYQTSARLLVSDPPAMRSIDYSAMVSSQSMTGTYAEMLVDRPVLEGVIERLSLPTTPEDLGEKITVEIVRNTQLLVVTVEDPSPTLAAGIANTLGQVFAERIRELQTQRYSATQSGLAKQVGDMEQQIYFTSQALVEEHDPAQKLQLEARLTEYRRLYSNLVTNYEQVRLAEAQTSTNVVVSQPAAPPREPVRPKTVQNTLLAALAGMLLAAGAVFAIDALDDTLKNPDEIRQRFGLPVLGIIASHAMEGERPISLSQPRSPVAEAFRSMRTNITFAGVDRPLRRILITSATPQDGKTTVSTNLAVALAQGEWKAVLIDADLRRPQVHRKFGLPNRAGLSELFIHELGILPELIQADGVPGLAVITSGSLPPNPSELLTSRKLTGILDRLNQDYDLILIDTPPVLSVTDAVALAPGMDGVILVAKPGQTRRRDFQLTLEQLRAVNARILGVVLNDVETQSRKYGYYYGGYGSKYSHYYDQDSVLPKRKKTAPGVKAAS